MGASDDKMGSEIPEDHEANNNTSIVQWGDEDVVDLLDEISNEIQGYMVVHRGLPKLPMQCFFIPTQSTIAAHRLAAPLSAWRNGGLAWWRDEESYKKGYKPTL